MEYTDIRQRGEHWERPLFFSELVMAEKDNGDEKVKFRAYAIAVRGLCAHIRRIGR